MTSQEMYPELYTLRFYLKQGLQMLRKHPGISTLRDLISDYRKWKSQAYEEIFDDPKPWMASRAVRFLGKICTQNYRVFEYGSGASTMYFAPRVTEIISVEHNPDWYACVVEEARRCGFSNVRLELREPQSRTIGIEDQQPARPEDHASVFEGYKKVEFSAYSGMISDWPDESFDLVVVDGRARPSCMHYAWNKIRKGGYLLLDNSDRPHYREMCRQLDQKAEKKMAFWGPVAQNPNFQETTFWKR